MSQKKKSVNPNDLDQLKDKVDHLQNELEDKTKILSTETAQRQKVEKALIEINHQLRTTREHLDRSILLDPLTEIYNRRGLQQALTREINWIIREGSSLMALIINLDNFRDINDSLGYAVGDVILKEIAVRLKQALRDSDSIARIGGDEFIILLPRTREAEGVYVAEKLRLIVSNTPIYISNKDTTKVRASIAVTPVTSKTPSVDQLITKIYPLLALGKRTGKDNVTVDRKAEDEKTDRHKILSKTLELLREGKGIRAVKQPIIHLRSKEIIGYEFLSRLQFGEFEMPNDFFKICLEENILTTVDHACMRTCIAASKHLPDNVEKHLNLFPSTIIDIPVQSLIDEFPSGKARKSYCVEISEQQIIGDPSYLQDSLKAFKKEGITIAIDDVGFGNSCLESLIILEPNVFKIDRKCIDGVSKDPGMRRTLIRLIKVARALDCEVVAEGIEDEADATVLLDLGMSFGQGYLYGRPE